MGKVGKVLVVVLVVLVLAIAGVVYFNVLQSPSVESVDLEWGEVTEERTELVATVNVSNPNPFGLGVVGLSYDVSINDVELGSGVKKGVELEKGRFPLEFVIELNNSRLDEWWVSHLRNNESSVIDVDVGVVVDLFFTEFEVDVPGLSRSFSTDLLNEMDLGEGEEISYQGETFLVFEDVELGWENVSSGSSVIGSSFVVSNPNGFSVPLTEVRYEVFMNDVKLGDGSSESVLVEAGSSEVIDGSIVLNNSRVSDWWVSHLEKNEESDLRVEVSAVFSALGEEISVPVGSFESSFSTSLL